MDALRRYVMKQCTVEVTMIEAFLMIQPSPLMAVEDAMDVYEGSVPPSATFQVIDLDDNTEESTITPGPA